MLDVSQLGKRVLKDFKSLKDANFGTLPSASLTQVRGFLIEKKRWAAVRAEKPLDEKLEVGG